MSKYVKYVSSSHYGAPVMMGDRWGYCVEMLRTVLCTGFNEHTDVITLEVLNDKKFKATFASEHNYSEFQNITFSGSSTPELNAECHVDQVEDAFNIICESFNDLSGLVGSKYENLSNVKSIVTPLGFIEKFQDGNRSVFTTDEEEAFLYIDETQPTVWEGAITASRTPCIYPLVYMTDKKPDIDTDGKFILPYDTANPTWYKLKEYKNGTYNKSGIWSWVTYGLNTNSSGGNLLANRQIPMDYDIVGNGRMFYFMPKLKYITDIRRNLYYFGKINSDHDNNNNLPYILNTLSVASSEHVYGTNRYASFTIHYAPSNYSLHTFAQNIDIGLYSYGILKINNKTSPIYFSPSKNTLLNSLITSGGNHTDSRLTYPEKMTKKLYTSRLHVMTGDSYIGKLSGLLHVSNSSKLYFADGLVKKFSNSKKMFTLNTNFNSSYTGTGSSSIDFIYFISLDYKDWFNYE